MKDIRRQEREKGTFRRKQLPGKFAVRKLFGWSDKRYNKEYWKEIGNVGREIK